jgi:hypothetical protein
MKLDGSLFSVVGDTGVEKVIGALVANIWKGQHSNPPSSTHLLISSLFHR